jgi:hypothetical protein
VAVDSRGRIYVGVQIFHRIQRYSPDGRFERGWFVPTAGLFGLRTTADGHVEVATAGANKFLVFDADGRLLRSQEWMKEDRSAELLSDTESTGGFEVRGGLCPRIVDSRTGRTVVATPWHKRIIATPFPAAACAIGGLALAFVSSKWRRRVRTETTQR